MSHLQYKLRHNNPPNDMSVTFTGNRYRSYELLDDVILQRTGTKLKPVSELQTRIDKSYITLMAKRRRILDRYWFCNENTKRFNCSCW